MTTLRKKKGRERISIGGIDDSAETKFAYGAKKDAGKRAK